MPALKYTFDVDVKLISTAHFFVKKELMLVYCIPARAINLIVRYGSRS